MSAEHPLHDGMPNYGQSIKIQDYEKHPNKTVELKFLSELSYIRINDFEDGDYRNHIHMQNNTFAKFALWFLWRWIVFDWCGLRTKWHVRRYIRKVKRS